ncbi:MAG: hypothetical protein HY657_20345 [Acidobacteria bacterium]|nr:hypothetical protein [Acidobacteriota bacterium]
MTRLGCVAVLLTTLTVPVVWAHDGHVHKIMGTVTARGDEVVEVRTPSGEVLSIAINAKTVVRRDKRKVAVTAVEVGRRVVVDIGNGEDPLIAREIQVGVAEAVTK